jgi:hypothetical protein
MRTLLISVSMTFVVLLPFVFLARGEAPIPFDLQAKLLLKVLTFDRNLENRADSTVVVGIVYTMESEDSQRARAEFSKALEKYTGKKVKGHPLSQVSLRFSSWSDLAAKVKSHNVSVLYVTPGDSFYLKGVIKASRADSVLTTTGITKYVEQGISIGIGLKENNPQIIINLSSAKAEGCDFSSQLLKLAKVIE